AEVVFNYLCSVANNFAGAEDEQWSMALDIFGDAFPHYGDTPEGFNPMQQHLAWLILDKVRDNMHGWYPAITRVLLAVIGPYGSHKVKEKSAYKTLEDAFYFELLRLPILQLEKPEKVQHYLPPNVKYDPERNTLIQTYRDGATRETGLSALKLEAIDLFSEILFIESDRVPLDRSRE
ncbi:MAG: hypothetical protein RLP02_34635, partial [Coleofasciculus sp. C2-GNP5-27]